MARQKVYVSAKHEKHKSALISPGPVYSVPSSLGQGLRFGFGTDEQRKHPRAKYPDTSVDLTCAEVDSQPIKFHATKGVHFGTEGRTSTKNAEILAAHPAAEYGKASPGATEYSPQDDLAKKNDPAYSFGPKAARMNERPVPRISAMPTSTPRHVGPGSHPLPPSIGAQPSSARPSAPKYSFGTEERLSARSHHRQIRDSSPGLSSMGRQVVSTSRTAPQCGWAQLVGGAL